MNEASSFLGVDGHRFWMDSCAIVGRCDDDCAAVNSLALGVQHLHEERLRGGLAGAVPLV